MKTTGIFTTSRYTINLGSSGQEVYIIPFGDIHKFAPLHSAHHWKLFLDEYRDRENVYFLGMGDYMDLASASERDILRDRRLHDSSVQTLEELYDTHTRNFYDDVSFMRGKCIGLIEGNHYAEYSSGITSTQKLCEMLQCRYLGVSCFIRVSLVYKDTKHTSLDIWAHHGKGAARLIGGSLNRVQQMGEMAEADIYIMGHDHKKSAGMASRLRLNGGGGGLKVVHRKQLYIRAGSFQRGYVDGMPSYVADGCMNPTDLGVAEITVTPKKLEAGLEFDLKATI